MDVLSKLFQVLGYIINYNMNIFGYSISFMNIFAFVIIVGVSALFIRNLLS